ncbi:hypothetical protein VTJ49DRAFT_3545 [Mycothermus thermophilus]|uniref:Pseudouridine synthase I TruA alpha/beta domain-containing protein n=1 Tax=Humicola insolens TaxID=85995 RepID=A0ABR3V8A6_HUMIN
MADTPSDPYQDWSRDRLLERIRELEQGLEPQAPPAPPKNKKPKTAAPGGNPQPPPKQKQPKKKKGLDPSKYSTRFIALKLAYLGKRYGGFEYQPNVPVPSIEEELWRALVRSCLIWPDDPDKIDFAPWGYSKCGRTDRGVSAFGQVVALRVRSNRPVKKEDEGEEMAVDGGGADDGKPAWDPIADEINYPRVLNRLLPPDIRVLAWAPTLPANFSARFSCRERQYRYFFTQPAFSPLPGRALDPTNGRPGAEGWLDIEAMRQAAKLFEGVHDFRNVCKIDGAKQISNFTRRVFEADIVEVEDAASALPYVLGSDFRPEGMALDGKTHPKVYYFHVRGSAFLWHQIRHMVAILFLVGQGLEKPSVVTELLDVERNPRKPNYQMADEVPLVLWDCIFPKLDEGGSGSGRSTPEVHQADAEVDLNLKDSIDWVWLGEDKPLSLHGGTGLVDQLWATWREHKMDELLAGQLLDAVARQADLSRRLAEPAGGEKMSTSQRVFEGGNSARSAGAYVPVMKKQLMPSPEEVNEKWAQSKGFASAEELANTKNWRSVMKAKKAAAEGAATSIEE